MNQLPNGDLWTAPTLELTKDEAGNVIDLAIIPRKDTVNVQNMPAVGKMSPDVAAMLMADLARKNEPAK